MDSADPILIRGPALVFGGNYGNLEATRALLAQARRLGVPAGNIVCTGDVVAYCADPLATIEVMRRAGVHVVMGNCEESLGRAATGCGCGFAEGSACDRYAAEWYSFASRMLDEDSRAWMRTLPRRLELRIGARRLAVVHGAVSAINRFVFASTAPAAKQAEIDASGCDAVLAGHCGLPFTQLLAGRLWHNAGAIGMPANDGTPRVWYSLIHSRGERIRIESRPLDYDHATAARKMRRLRLCEPYAQALEDGLWPSCDVLPPEELARRGLAIAASTTDW